MSNEKNSCIPRLRFPGFEGEWEYVNGNELFEPISNKNHNSDLPILALTQEQGAVPRDEINYKVIVSDKSVAGYKVVEVDDFIISLRSFQGGIEYSRYKGLCSPAYIVLRKKFKGISSDFYRIYFKSFNYIQALNKNLEGIRDGKMISYSQFSEIKLPNPSFPEQQKIASCLSELDNLIATQGQKVDALKEKKKGLMQQLFPQPGETTPRLRFPGFEGEWVEKKLGDLIEESRESSINENEDILLTSSIDGMYLNSEVFSHQRGSSTIGYRKIKKGMLILSAQNLHLGNANVNLRFDSGLVSPAYKVYYIVGCLPQYLAQWIKRKETKRFFFNATTQGASECRRNVVWEQLYKQVLSIPSQAEQQKIASCLSSLDDLIAAESAKVEALKDHKKGLMQQLFPQPTK